MKNNIINYRISKSRYNLSNNNMDKFESMMKERLEKEYPTYQIDIKFIRGFSVYAHTRHTELYAPCAAFIDEEKYRGIIYKHISKFTDDIMTTL